MEFGDLIPIRDSSHTRSAGDLPGLQSCRGIQRSGGTAAISEQPTADMSFLEDRMERKFLLNVVKRDPERCLIEAAADRTVAFQGDAVDAPFCVAAIVG